MLTTEIPSLSLQMERILYELNQGLRTGEDDHWRTLQQQILEAPRIFLYGQGRSGLAIRAFANRLGHLGKETHFIGEITCPPIQKGDLIIAGSASGCSQALNGMFDKAREYGAKTAALTTSPNNPLASKSDLVCLAAGHAKGETDGSVQPMGALFEQSLWLSLDALVLCLMDATKQKDEDLHRRHANLEA